MLSNVSKMPGKSISLDAFECKTGSKLAKIKGSVCFDCYARKGMYRMPNVRNKMVERMAFFNAIDFVPRMVEMLNKTRSEYFRWFDSGDTQDVRMALNIIDVIKATPNKKHWIPTKERKIWLEALKIEPLPNNAVLRFSATMVDDAPPEAWKHSSMVIKDAAPVGHECPAPKQGGKCGPCRACWSHDVKTITYHKH
jgi:hypothetical protein|tara:strand:+ start:259 stop:846 length:588 start_codon:yes stop_codon:yes gene_type:complete